MIMIWNYQINIQSQMDYKIKTIQWSCFIAIRSVSKKNIRQAKAHLSRCNNIESHHCKCHEVQ